MCVCGAEPPQTRQRQMRAEQRHGRSDEGPALRWRSRRLQGTGMRIPLARTGQVREKQTGDRKMRITDNLLFEVPR
jgi:hypothetical protein